MRCDPPIAVLEVFLQKLKSLENSSEGKIDVILVPGDLVAHGVPLDLKNLSAPGDYQLLK